MRSPLPRLLLLAPIFCLCSSVLFLPSAIKAAWLGLVFAYGLRWLAPWQEGIGWNLERVGLKRVLWLGLAVGLVAALPIFLADLLMLHFQPDWLGGTHFGLMPKPPPGPWVGTTVSLVYAIGFYLAYAQGFRQWPLIRQRAVLLVTACSATVFRLLLPELAKADLLAGCQKAMHQLGDLQGALQWCETLGLGLLGVLWISVFSSLPFVVGWFGAVGWAEPVQREWRRASRNSQPPGRPECLPASRKVWCASGAVLVIFMFLSTRNTLGMLQMNYSGGLLEYSHVCRPNFARLQAEIGEKLKAGEDLPADLYALYVQAEKSRAPSPSRLVASRETWLEERLNPDPCQCPAVANHYPDGKTVARCLYLLRGIPAASIVNPGKTIAAFDPIPVHGQRQAPAYHVLLVGRKEVESWQDAEILTALDAMTDPAVFTGCAKRTEAGRIRYDFTNGASVWSLVYADRRFRLFDAAGQEISGK